MRVVEVAELTAYVKDLLQSDPILSNIWVRGEISNFVRSSAGHIYFTLKSDSAQIRCVLFRGNARFLNFNPTNGDAVMAHGKVEFYEVSGQCQLYVDILQPEGTGLLQLQFEELRMRLELEGLFDPGRKRPLPPYPRHIGVVTSATGAVWHDIQNVLSRRYPLCELILAPAMVQGSDAAATIIAALNALQDDGRAEVIIVGRGGGSAEDLACFNDERLARAIFAASVPVMSAVGHETDFTIADFVADLRAPTPSAAAELVAPDIRVLMHDTLELHDRTYDAIQEAIQSCRAQLERATFRLSRVSPASAIRFERQRLDGILDSIRYITSARVDTERAKIAATTRELALLHPQQIMERGYAMVIDRSTGARANSAATLYPTEEILLRFHDGVANATVTDATHSTPSPVCEGGGKR
jgi:exodeoxyribonuclease VII large subunit